MPIGSSLTSIATLEQAQAENNVIAGYTEMHAHSNASWLGLRDSVTDEINVAESIWTKSPGGNINPFRLTAGNNQFGNWTIILGSGDTPQLGSNFYDMGYILWDDVQWDKNKTIIQFAYDSNPTQAFLNNRVTTVLAKPAKDIQEVPVRMRCHRIPLNTKAWARVWVYGQVSGWVDFFYQLHDEY